ncbi:3'-5' exonuclease [Fulvivirga sp. M361]|uniref:3'-5' exonuclease n=1 Tax=Fulvivirga sp. M361 TaxID=2594266 RepID=UPI0016280E5F|nr:3'-5' exonuclease [Fulvivirga sp. M361]
MFAETISNEEINELDLKGYEGKITVVDNTSDLAPVFRKLKKETFVGFDTETKPSFRKGESNKVSLLQLAGADEVFLIRLNYTGITDQLKDFLASDVLKVGVALRDDIKDLQRLRHYKPQGFLELNQIVKDIGIESNGLRKLTAILLDFRISKAAQTSNWENAELTPKQLQYAATDAWVCYEMYKKLVDQGYIS